MCDVAKSQLSAVKTTPPLRYHVGPYVEVDLSVASFTVTELTVVAVAATTHQYCSCCTY